MSSNYNLPPGVTDNMIPGNTREDLEWEALMDRLIKDSEKYYLSAEEARYIWEDGLGMFLAKKGRLSWKKPPSHQE